MDKRHSKSNSTDDLEQTGNFGKSKTKTKNGPYESNSSQEVSKSHNTEKTPKLVSDIGIETFESETDLPKLESNNTEKPPKLVSEKGIKTFESETDLPKPESNNAETPPKLVSENGIKTFESESNLPKPESDKGQKLSRKPILKKHSNDETEHTENLVKTESRKSFLRIQNNSRPIVFDSTESVDSFSRALSQRDLSKDQAKKERPTDNEDETNQPRKTATKKLLGLVSDIRLPAAETEDSLFPDDDTDQYHNFIKNTIGEFGSFQFILLLLMYVARITVSMHKQATSYLQTPVNMTCAEYVLHTQTDLHYTDNIFMIESVCDNPNCTVIFDTSVYDNTMITEYNLICERYYLSDLQHSILMFGGMVGNFVFGYIAAKYGRYISFLISTVMTSFFGLLTGLAPNLEVLTAFRFFCGFGVAGLMSGYLLLLETTGNKYRFVASLFYQFGYASGVILLAFFAYLIRNWRSWYIVISSPLAFLILFYIIQLNESPRWLLIQGHVNKCVTTLEQIAIFNNKPKEHIDVIVRDIHKKIMLHPNEQQFKTLFRSRLLFRTITLCCAYIVHALTSHGSSSYYRPMDESVFAFSFLLGISLVPGTLVTFLLSKFLTLKNIAFYTAVLLMMTIVLRFMLTNNLSGHITLAITYNFFQMVFQTALMLLVVHLFPTTLRSQAQGLIQASANIGSMLAPYPLHLSDHNSVGPMLLYFFLWCFTISLMHFYLPDELEEGLPDTYSQIKQENKCCANVRKLNKIDVVR